MTDDPRDVFPDRLDALVAGDMQPSVEQVAAAARVRPVDVERWLEGLAFPCPLEFERLRAFLNVSRDDLLTCR